MLIIILPELHYMVKCFVKFSNLKFWWLSFTNDSVKKDRSNDVIGEYLKKYYITTRQLFKISI